MNVNEMFPSKNLKAADLEGHAIKVVIERLEQQEVGQEKDLKWVVKFVGKEKGLVLNVTNANMIAAHLGDDIAGWTNREIVLYPDKVPFNGKIVDAIRVKIPVATPAPVSSNGDEDIPF